MGLARVIVAIIFIPLIVLILYLGGYAFSVFIAGLMIIGLLEFRDLAIKKNATVLLWLVWPAALLLAWFAHQGQTEFFLPLLFALILLLFIIAMYRKEPILDSAATLIAFIYAAFLMSTMILLRQYSVDAEGMIHPSFGFQTIGFQIVAGILAAIWSCDTLAYYGGRLFGRHKLFERVSPNKTWEGALSGFAGAFGGVFLFQHLLGALDIPFLLTVPDMIVISALAGTLGQIGDLAESWLKRNAGVKDSGSLLPGHGGILDRFDSLLFVAPSVYIYFYYLR